MVYIIDDFKQESLANMLDEIRSKNKKDVLVEQSFDGSTFQEYDGQEWNKRTLSAHFGCLKRGIDGLEYQKSVRNEWS